jgi:hypothetical protein
VTSKWRNGVLGLVLLFGAVMLLLAYNAAGSDGGMTEREALLFNGLIAIVSVAASLLSLVGEVERREDEAETNAKKLYQQLATPAYRRVVGLRNSAAVVAETLELKRGALSELDGDDTWIMDEWLDSLERLLRVHSDQLDAALDDWQELLPDEYDIAKSHQQLTRKIEDLTAEARAQREVNDELRGQVESQAELRAQLAELVRERNELAHRSVASAALQAEDARTYSRRDVFDVGGQGMEVVALRRIVEAVSHWDGGIARPTLLPDGGDVGDLAVDFLGRRVIFEVKLVGGPASRNRFPGVAKKVKGWLSLTNAAGAVIVLVRARGHELRGPLLQWYRDVVLEVAPDANVEVVALDPSPLGQAKFEEDLGAALERLLP